VESKVAATWIAFGRGLCRVETRDLTPLLLPAATNKAGNSLTTSTVSVLTPPPAPSAPPVRLEREREKQLVQYVVACATHASGKATGGRRLK
jgi:hypothetical protein